MKKNPVVPVSDLITLFEDMKSKAELNLVNGLTEEQKKIKMSLAMRSSDHSERLKITASVMKDMEFSANRQGMITLLDCLITEFKTYL
jgi:hypothetical protein